MMDFLNGSEKRKKRRQEQIVYLFVLLGFVCFACFPIKRAYFAEASQKPLEFSLFDAAGQRHTPQEWKGARAVVLFFIATECPISNRYAPEINRLVDDYASQPVIFYGVHSDPDIGAPAVRQYARDFSFNFPVLLDPTQLLAGNTGVTLTPTAVILS